MSSHMFSPAADILKALGITETNVLRYSLHFSAKEVTVCRVDVAVCRDPLNRFEEQLKSYKVTLEPLEIEPAAEPELFMLQDGPKAVAAIDLEAMVRAERGHPPIPREDRKR